MQQTKIGSPQYSVLLDVKPISTADVDSRFLAHLHGSLRARRSGPPHCGIVPMTRLGALNRRGHSIEFCRMGSFTGRRRMRMDEHEHEQRHRIERHYLPTMRDHHRVVLVSKGLNGGSLLEKRRWVSVGVNEAHLAAQH